MYSCLRKLSIPIEGICIMTVNYSPVFKFNNLCPYLPLFRFSFIQQILIKLVHKMLHRRFKNQKYIWTRSVILNRHSTIYSGSWKFGRCFLLLWQLGWIVAPGTGQGHNMNCYFSGQSCTMKNDLILIQLPSGLDYHVGGNLVHNYPSLDSNSNICNFLNFKPKLSYMYTQTNTEILLQSFNKYIAFRPFG